MAGELEAFDTLPPGLVDQVVAWCFLHYPSDGRNASIAALVQQYGQRLDVAGALADAAITRAASWTAEQAQALADAAEGWDAPVPLAVGADLPEFPAGVYPRWIEDMVTAVAEFTQTPRDLPAVVALSVLAAALGGRAVVDVRPRWCEPVNLYTAVALPSGSRKSAVHAELTAPLLMAEREMTTAAAAGIAEAATQRSIADKAAAKAAAAAGADPSDRDKTATAIAAAQLAESITVPVMPRLLADDVTPEAAASLMAEQGGRLAVLSAEGGPFVSLAGRYSREPNLEVFLKGHNGDMLRVDRKGRAPEFIARPALTLGLTVQPEVLKMISGMPGFHGRGLLARVLYSMPVNTVGRRRIRTELIPEQTGENYATSVYWLARIYAEWTDPARIQLGNGARERLLREAEAIEPRLGPGGDLSHIADWGSKLCGETARIAALLHAAEHVQNAWMHPVSEDTMARAIEAGRYFTRHALTVFDFMGADPAVADARVVLDWIRRMGRPQFSRRALHRGMQARFRKAADTDAPLDVLAEHGWIRAAGQVSRARRTGRPPSAIYDVHPALLRS